MKTYKSNRKNKKISEKINYVKLLLVLIIPLIIFTSFFYYIGGKRDIGTSIQAAAKISLLLGIGSIVGDLIENRNRIFIIDKEDLGYIDIHTEKVGGPYLKDREFYDIIDKHEVEEVYKNNYQYEGIDKGVIKSIISLKKRNNRIVVKARVLEKVWKSASAFTITKLYIVEKEGKRKIIIPNDFDNYNELYNELLKKSKI